MTPVELDRNLAAHKIPPLLFLFGEETFSLERTLQRVLDLAVPPDTRDFNYNVYHGRESRAENILDTVRTLPLFAAHRMVLVKDAQNLAAAELEAFVPYLQDPMPETVLVFTADKIDRRKKFFQEFNKKGELVEYKKLYDNQIPAFVKSQAHEAGRSFTEDALALFCRRMGTNLQEVHGELSKLFAYLGERNLADVKDVAAVVSDTRVDSIFDLTNAMGDKNTGEALRLLSRLLAEGVAPLLILSMMVRHFRQLWKTRELLEQGTGKQDLCRRIGINPYFLDGLVKQARRFSSVQYRHAFELFLDVDMALKSSGAHPAVLLEKLVQDIAVGEPG
jgi:DNA polymerase-3 subunit delta